MRTLLCTFALVSAACASSTGRADLDAATLPVATLVVTTDGRPGVVALDATHIYWVEIAQSPPYPTSIRRQPRAGGAAEQLVSMTGSISALALDVTRVYFAMNGSVMRVGKDGTALATVRQDDNGESLALDGDALFWGDATRVLTGSATGTDVAPLAASRTQAGPLAVDASDVFWIEWDTRRVMGVDRRGGTTRVLATEPCPVEQVALAGDNVYWLERADCPITNDFMVRRVPRAGGAAPTTVAGHASAYAMQGVRMYWVGFDSLVHRVDANGTTDVGSVRDTSCSVVGGVGGGVSVGVCIAPSAMVADAREVFFAGYTEHTRRGWIARLPAP